MGKFIETENRGDQGLEGGGKRSYCLMGVEFLLKMMKTFWVGTLVVETQHVESM